jgi:hypothetical protein
LSGALASAVGFRLVGPITAGHLIIAWGYYYILGLSAAFAFFAVRVLRERRAVWAQWLRRPGWAGAAIAGGLLFAAWSEPFRHKVLFDEYVIQGTAYEMHVAKQVSTVLRAYEINGTWLPIDTFLDKRPYFFPFLVSLLHDLAGYRTSNLFIVNMACAGALLALLYWLALQIAGRGPALLAVALFATMPLFAQNATGAGMDLHNVAMIALVACLGVLYLRVPSDDRLTLLVLGSVLLTESRYESVVFVLPAAAVVVAGWLKAGRVILPWPVVLAPILLVPCAFHLRVLGSEPIFWQLQEGQTSAFGWENIAKNFSGDMRFMFNLGPGLANSWYLSAAGACGLLWCAALAWRRARARGLADLPAPVFVAAAFGAGVALHFCVLLFYWWARFDDLLASRFSLPICLSCALLAAALARGLEERRLPGVRILAAGLGVWILTGGFPAMAARTYTDENLVMQELNWEHGLIASRPGPVLVITNRSTIPFVLWHIPAIISAVGMQRGEQIRYHMGQGTFREVLVVQNMRPTTPDGDYGVDPGDLMPLGYHLETIAEKRFGANLARVSRILSIDAQPEGPAGAPQGPARPSPLRFISEIQSLSGPSVAPATSPAPSR